MDTVCLNCNSEKMELYHAASTYIIYRCKDCGKFIFHWGTYIDKEGRLGVDVGQVLNEPKGGVE